MTSAVELKSPNGTDKFRLEYSANTTKTIDAANLRDVNAITSMINNRIGSTGPSGDRNILLDGNMDLWTAVSQTSSGYGSTTYWCQLVRGDTRTVTQQTLGVNELPYLESNSGINSYCSLNITSAAGAANYTSMYQGLENVRSMAGQQVTISFYARSSVANKKIAVSHAQVFGTGGSANVDTAAGNVSLTTSWARYSLTYNVPTISGKTVGAAYTDHNRIYFWFDAGSNYNGLTTSIGQLSAVVDITGIMLEYGSIASPPSGWSPNDTSKLERYYLRGTYDQFIGYQTSWFGAYVQFASTIRTASPTISIIADGVAGRVRISDVPTYSTAIGVSVYIMNVQSMQVCVTDGSAKERITFNYIVDCRL